MGLIPLGFWAASGAGGAPTSADYELISTTVLGSAAASVTFSGLGTSAAAYKHLQIRATVRSTNASSGDTIVLRLNADTGTNYSSHLLYGTGSAVGSFGESSATYIRALWSSGSSSSSNVFGAGVVDILDFSNTSKNKTVRGLTGNYGESQIRLTSGAWLSTSAATSITIFSANGANLDTGSRFSLYGLK